MKYSKGFTLIELFIIISILAIIAAMFAPHWFDKSIKQEVGRPAPINAASRIYLLEEGSSGAIYTFHDESKHVSCWAYSNGGISCLPDVQINENKK